VRSSWQSVSAPTLPVFRPSFADGVGFHLVRQMDINSQGLQSISQSYPAYSGFHGDMHLAGQLSEEVTQFFQIIVFSRPWCKQIPFLP